MKRAVSSTSFLSLAVIARWTAFVLLANVFWLTSCHSSRRPLATLGTSANAWPAETPRARHDSASFSKNFFSAFPLVRLQISKDAKPKRDASNSNKESLEFLFDTGNAGLSVLDVSVAQRLGLELTPSGSISFAGITLPTLRAKAPAVQILQGAEAANKDASLQLRDITFQVVDLTPFAEFAGRRVDGILGADVIKRFVTTVDYRRQIVSFKKQPGKVVEGAGQTILPFELRQGWIVVPTQINGQAQEEMILDTGAPITTFSRDRAARHGFELRQARPTTLMLPIGKLTWLPHRLQEIEFGGLKVSDAAAVVISSNEGLFTAGTGMSLLGANVLRHFVLTIDYQRRQLILEPDAEFQADPDEYTSIGVLPMLRDGRFYVSGVVNGSPADAEGVESGDEILAVDGQKMDQFSFGELVDALRGQEGSALQLTVRRGQRTIELPLKRVRLL